MCREALNPFRRFLGVIFPEQTALPMRRPHLRIAGGRGRGRAVRPDSPAKWRWRQGHPPPGPRWDWVGGRWNGAWKCVCPWPAPRARPCLGPALGCAGRAARAEFSTMHRRGGHVPIGTGSRRAGSITSPRKSRKPHWPWLLGFGMQEGAAGDQGWLCGASGPGLQPFTVGSPASCKSHSCSSLWPMPLQAPPQSWGCEAWLGPRHLIRANMFLSLRKLQGRQGERSKRSRN